ncbi:MAG: hypothetical protein JWP57_4043 [Spirosoma sp.]|nr:hypothetical protein [Spirosoma sp.]
MAPDRYPPLRSGPSAQRSLRYQKHRREPTPTPISEKEQVMEALSTNTAADLISLVHHAPGFRPRESLVCVSLNRNQVGATLRIDLPAEETDPWPCARKTTDCLSNDPEATTALFLLYTAVSGQPGAAKPIQGLILPAPAVLPLTTPTDGIAADVERTIQVLIALPRHQLLTSARTLWNELLDHGNYPTNEQATQLLSYFQLPELRDLLMADMPGINEPPIQILLARTHASPHWERVDWAEQLLIHLYTHDPTEHSAPVLTAVSLLSWWEGKGSKALQFTQLALELNPKFTPAHLIQQMLQAGLIAPGPRPDNKPTGHRDHDSLNLTCVRT